MVGFLSIFSVVMVFIFLQAAFKIGDTSDVPQPVPQTPEAIAKAQAKAAADAAEAANQIIPKSAMPLVGLIYSVIAFICTVNMLDGANWARWLYTVSYLLILICDIMVYSDHFIPYIPALFVRGIVIPFLFFPAANDFFKTPN
jgi:CHASE2 domain-containing sensor protein